MAFGFRVGCGVRVWPRGFVWLASGLWTLLRVERKKAIEISPTTKKAWTQTLRPSEVSRTRVDPLPPERVGPRQMALSDAAGDAAKLEASMGELLNVRGRPGTAEVGRWFDCGFSADTNSAPWTAL